jgi:ankyrin repeat protein
MVSNKRSRNYKDGDYTPQKDVKRGKKEQKPDTLRMAILREDIPAMEIFLEGVDVEKKVPGSRYTPLMWTVVRGLLKSMRYLVEKKGAKTTYKTKGKDLSIIHSSVNYGHINVLKYLVKKAGVCHLHFAFSGKTPVHDAILLGNLEMVKFFFKECNTKNHSTETGWLYKLSNGKVYDCFGLSCYAGNNSITEFLCSKLKPCTRERYQGLIIATRRGDINTVKLLVKKLHTKVNCTHPSNNFLPLMISATEGFTDIFEFFIMEGSDVLTTDRDGISPIHKAAEYGHQDIINIAIKAGAEISKTTILGHSPLRFSLCNNREDVSIFFMESGADVMTTCKEGFSALYVAAEYNQIRTISWIIQNRKKSKVDLDVKTAGGGFTPIFIAAKNGNIQIVDLLMQSGANPSIASKSGDTPIRVACASSSHSTSIVKLLAKHPDADFNAGTNGLNPVYSAIGKGDLETVIFLVKKCGSNVTSDRILDWSPVDLSIDTDNLHITRWLINNSDAEVIRSNNISNITVRLWTQDRNKKCVKEELLGHNIPKELIDIVVSYMDHLAILSK